MIEEDQVNGSTVTDRDPGDRRQLWTNVTLSVGLDLEVGFKMAASTHAPAPVVERGRMKK